MKVQIKPRDEVPEGRGLLSEGYEVLLDGQNLDDTLGLQDIEVAFLLGEVPRVRLQCVALDADLDIEAGEVEMHVVDPAQGLARTYRLVPAGEPEVLDPKQHALAKARERLAEEEVDGE